MYGRGAVHITVEHKAESGKEHLKVPWVEPSKTQLSGLLYDKTFSGEAKYTYLLNLVRELVADQSMNTTKVQFDEPMILVGLFTIIWMSGCLQDQK